MDFYFFRRSGKIRGKHRSNIHNKNSYSDNTRHRKLFSNMFFMKKKLSHQNTKYHGEESLESNHHGSNHILVCRSTQNTSYRIQTCKSQISRTENLLDSTNPLCLSDNHEKKQTHPSSIIKVHQFCRSIMGRSIFESNNRT